MKINSITYRSDLFFIEYSGLVSIKEDYIVIKSPNNPTAHWGNFILFPSPPVQGDFERWTNIFNKEIGKIYNSRHIALAWDDFKGNAGVIEPFIENGFEVNRSIALQLNRRKIRLLNAIQKNIIIRIISTNNDWENVLKNQILCRPVGYRITGYTKYKKEQILNYKRMWQSGLGAWFGVFVNGLLVADLGLYFQKKEKWGRFQKVETIPDFRNKGIATSLITYVSNYAFEIWNLEHLIIVAEKDTQAERIYAQCGFNKIEEVVNVVYSI